MRRKHSKTLLRCLVIDLKLWPVIAKGNSASASTTSGESVLSGRIRIQAHPTLRLSIITRRTPCPSPPSILENNWLRSCTNLGMSASELARKLDVPPNRITAILNGQRGITGDTALRLAHFFGTSAAVLAQSAKHLRVTLSPAESRKSHPCTPQSQAARTCFRMIG